MTDPELAAAVVSEVRRHDSSATWQGDTDKATPIHCACGGRFVTHRERTDHVVRMVAQLLDKLL